MMKSSRINIYIYLKEKEKKKEKKRVYTQNLRHMYASHVLGEYI